MDQQQYPTMDQQQYPTMYPISAPPTPGSNMEAGLIATGLPVQRQLQLGEAAPTPAGSRDGWAGNDPNTLIVVATLITALNFLLGLSMPGGYWQTDQTVVSNGGGGGLMVVHRYRAGDPIMRDLHRPRYWLFRGASWVGVASSMVMTLSLLVRMPVGSRHVLWSFAVAYSSLVLTFIVSQSRTHLSLDVLIWLAVLVLIWLVINLHPDHRARVIRVLFCCNRDN